MGEATQKSDLNLLRHQPTNSSESVERERRLHDNMSGLQRQEASNNQHLAPTAEELWLAPKCKGPSSLGIIAASCGNSVDNKAQKLGFVPCCEAYFSSACMTLKFKYKMLKSRKLMNCAHTHETKGLATDDDKNVSQSIGQYEARMLILLDKRVYAFISRIMSARVHDAFCGIDLHTCKPLSVAISCHATQLKPELSRAAIRGRGQAVAAATRNHYPAAATLNGLLASPRFQCSFSQATSPR